MRDVILIAGFAVALPMCFWRPWFGLLVWSFFGYMNPHRLTWGVAYDLPFVAVAAAATLAGLIFGRERMRFPVSAVTVVWILFVLWTIVTTQFAVAPDDASYELSRMLKVQAMIAVTLLIMGSRQRLEILVATIALSIGFYGLKGGIFTVATGGAYRVWGPYGSFIEGNNEIAFALLIVMPLLKYMFDMADNKWIRRGLLATMVFSAFAIVGSYSRGAFLGGAAMAFAMWLKSPRKLRFAVPAVLLCVLVVGFMPDSWTNRMETIQDYEQDDSAMGRINAWHFAVNLAADRPITGGGFGTFTPALFQKYAPSPDDFHDAHSIFFEVLAEQGYVGLVLFVSLGLLAFRTGSWVTRAARDRPDLLWVTRLARMTQVSLIGYTVGGLFLGLAYFDLPYHLMAILVLLKQHTREQLAGDVPERQPAAAGEHQGAAGAAP